MDLLCLEIDRELKSIIDPVVVDDDRILKIRMINEKRYIISSSYFNGIQTELKTQIRKSLSDWMLKVCKVEFCQKEVFPLAINILERFLTIVKIQQDQFQLLGAVCLFIASKLRESPALRASNLVDHTNNSILLKQLLEWELLVLNKLNWDLAAIIPNDFLIPLMRKLFKFLKLSEFQSLIEEKAQTLIEICAVDWTFSMTAPSILASTILTIAIENLFTHGKNSHLRSMSLIHHLHEITGIDLDKLQTCKREIEMKT